MKKRLTTHEEFDILKLVLDKILWFGFGILAYGYYKLVQLIVSVPLQGITFVISGVVILAVLMFLVIKEYEILA